MMMMVTGRACANERERVDHGVHGCIQIYRKSFPLKNHHANQKNNRMVERQTKQKILATTTPTVTTEVIRISDDIEEMYNNLYQHQQQDGNRKRKNEERSTATSATANYGSSSNGGGAASSTGPILMLWPPLPVQAASLPVADGIMMTTTNHYSSLLQVDIRQVKTLTEEEETDSDDDEEVEADNDDDEAVLLSSHLETVTSRTTTSTKSSSLKITATNSPSGGSCTPVATSTEYAEAPTRIAAVVTPTPSLTASNASSSRVDSYKSSPSSLQPISAEQLQRDYSIGSSHFVQYQERGQIGVCEYPVTIIKYMDGPLGQAGRGQPGGPRVRRRLIMNPRADGGADEAGEPDRQAQHRQSQRVRVRYAPPYSKATSIFRISELLEATPERHKIYQNLLNKRAGSSSNGKSNGANSRRNKSKATAGMKRKKR